MTTNTTVLVTGNTYPVKDAIKALGGRWDSNAKGWRVPADKAAQAQALVAGAPKAAPRKAGTSRSNGGSVGRMYQRRYGWDGVRGSSSYYSSGMYDEES